MNLRLQLLVPAVVVALISAAGTLSAQSIQYPSSAERWGVFEIVLSGPSAGNPYVDVSLGATFARNGSSVSVAGFYDGGGTYRIRFMPSQEGSWSFTTTSNVAALSGRTGAFTATSPAAEQPRPGPGPGPIPLPVRGRDVPTTTSAPPVTTGPIRPPRCRTRRFRR